MNDKEIQEVTQRLREKYGEMLTLQEAAKVLRKSTDVLKVSLNSGTRNHVRWVQRLKAGRVKIGRRIYFRPVCVAIVLVLGDAEEKRYED